MTVKKLIILFAMTAVLSFNIFADEKDGIKPLKEGVEPTDAQAQVIRDGAKARCEDIEDDDDKREQCVANYYVQHNLDEEPSCD